MVLTKEELKIINFLKKELFKQYTIREIMKGIEKNSYNWTFEAVKKLNSSGIIEINKKGNSSLCSLNLNNKLTITYLSFLEENNANLVNLPKKNIFELIDSIPLSYFTFIVTGSYVEGKASKKSDIDVMVIIENEKDVKKILTILKNKGQLMIPEAHPYVFTKEEFLKMLLDIEVNYAKLTFKKRVIFFGAENYYIILKEAIKNGFKG